MPIRRGCKGTPRAEGEMPIWYNYIEEKRKKAWENYPRDEDGNVIIYINTYQEADARLNFLIQD